MSLEPALADARSAVTEWFPDCRAAWLGGSIVRGTATQGSDLDITVLLDGPPAPFRDSRRYAAWPVELFVHGEPSLRDYDGREVASRRPTLPRLVGDSVVLMDRDGSGGHWQQYCRELLLAGPSPLTEDDRVSLRYAVTDLLDDLTHSRNAAEHLATATLLAEEAQQLLLLGERHWLGRGKWLTRELADLDDGLGTQWVSRFTEGLVAAVNGDIAALAALSSQVLHRNGGPLFEGHRQSGRVPDGGPTAETQGDSRPSRTGWPSAPVDRAGPTRSARSGQSSGASSARPRSARTRE